jgi:hypothetical protein
LRGRGKGQAGPTPARAWAQTLGPLRAARPTASYDAGAVRVTCVREAGGAYRVDVEAEEPRPMALHWGVDEWTAPADDVLPPGTVKVGGRVGAARRGRRIGGGDGLGRIRRFKAGVQGRRRWA